MLSSQFPEQRKRWILVRKRHHLISPPRAPHSQRLCPSYTAPCACDFGQCKVQRQPGSQPSPDTLVPRLGQEHSLRHPRVVGFGAWRGCTGVGLRSEAGEGGSASQHWQRGQQATSNREGALNQLRAGLEVPLGTIRFQGQARGAHLHLKPVQPHILTVGQGSPWLLPSDQHCPG